MAQILAAGTGARITGTLHPDDYVNQINYQKASGAILERKIQRLRNVSEEIRKYAVIMEGVIPADQLSPRIRMRLTQLLREWNNEPEQAIGGEMADESETSKQAFNRVQTRAKNRNAETKPAAQVSSSRPEIRLSSPAEKAREAAASPAQPLLACERQSEPAPEHIQDNG